LSNLAQYSGKIIKNCSPLPDRDAPVISSQARTSSNLSHKKELGLLTSHFPMIILVFAIIMSSLVSFSHAAETPKPIQLAILPCENIETTFKKFYPLLRYLIQQTGLEVSLMVPTDFSTFETSLRKGEIDFALQDPHTYLMTSNLYNNEALLRAL